MPYQKLPRLSDTQTAAIAEALKACGEILHLKPKHFNGNNIGVSYNWWKAFIHDHKTIKCSTVQVIIDNLDQLRTQRDLSEEAQQAAAAYLQAVRTVLHSVVPPERVETENPRYSKLARVSREQYDLIVAAVELVHIGINISGCPYYDVLRHSRDKQYIPKTSTVVKMVDEFEQVVRDSSLPDEARSCAMKAVVLAQQALSTILTDEMKNEMQAISKQYTACLDKEKNQRYAILRKRFAELDISQRDIARHFGVVSQMVHSWLVKPVSQETFAHITHELGIDTQGNPQGEMPQWMQDITNKRQIAFTQRDEWAKSLRTAFHIQDKVLPSGISQYQPERRTMAEEKLLDYSTQLGLYDRQDVVAYAKRGYFETQQLQEKVKPLGRAIAVLRTYWNMQTELLAEAMPDEQRRLSKFSINALESAEHPYGQESSPSQKILCNLLAGIFVVDSRQPPEKQLFKDSHELAFLAWAMAQDDSFFTLTNRLKIRVEKAIDDVIATAGRIEPDLQDPGGHYKIGLFHPRSSNRS